MAIDILTELKKGNISFLSSLSYFDKENIVSNIIGESKDKKEILNKILPIFRNEGNWYELAYEIFKLIYLDKDFNEYTFYLLHNQLVGLEDMSEVVFKNLLKNTTWGLDYIVDNIINIPNDIFFRLKMDIIIQYIGDNPKLYQQTLDKIMSFDSRKVKEQFIISSLSHHIYLDEKIIISSLYKNSDDYYYQQESLPFILEKQQFDFSKLPSYLSFYTKRDEKIKNMMIDNFELFFKIEKDNKMKIIDCLYNFLSKEILEKYNQIYSFYKLKPGLQIDRILTVILNNNMDDFLLEILKDHVVSYIGSGTTAMVFKVDDLVLKLSLTKHDFNTERDLFLIAPTNTKIIYDKDNNPVLILEIQKYLERSYNDQKMTLLDIEKFLNELDKLGYAVTDPNCLNKKFDNFGFLEDYHDANLGKFNSHEELPDWFKERPIVLYDVDLVYKKGYEKKKTFTL